MKIRTKINLTFLTIFTFIFLVVGFILGINSSRTLRQETSQAVVNINNAHAEHLRTYLNSEKEVISILGASTVFRDFLKLSKNSDQYQSEKMRVEKRLVRSIGSVPQIQELFILDKNGIIVASNDTATEGIDKSTDDYFINGKEEVHIKDFYFSEITKDYAYAISAPIKDDSTQKLLGIVVARMYTKNLNAIIESDVALGSTGENFIINSEKYFLTPSKYLGADVILKQKVETQNTADCFAPEEIAEMKEKAVNEYAHASHAAFTSYVDYRWKKIIGTHAYIPEVSWCLITKIDEAEILAPVYNLLWIYIFSFLTALILFFVLSNFLAQRIVNPIYQLRDGMKIVESGNLDYKIGIAGTDEVSQLAKSFDSLVVAVKKSRAEVDKKVKAQTQEIAGKAAEMSDQQKAILNILEDVEEEKEKTTILAKDLEKFKLAVDNASDHIVITDPDGLILYANRGVERITGFSIKEVLGQKAGNKQNWGGQMAQGVYQKLWQTIKKDKKNFIGELNNRHKNGEPYEVIASISPVLNAAGQVIFFVSLERDISKEKQIDKAKTEFVSLASHQLRTPLSAINWYAEMLLAGDVGKLKPQQQQYLEEIYRGNQRMVDLVNALLNVSRLELGTFTIEPSEINIVTLAESVLNELVVQIRDKKQRVEKKYDKKLPVKYSADEKLLRIVFQNLLSNAIKYTPAQGKISLSIWPEKDKIKIDVKDTGMGIPKNQQAKIFEKLFRADNVRATDTEGTGLGLYIVKALMDAIKGKINFQSVENKGTTFWIEMPATGWQKKQGTKTIS